MLFVRDDDVAGSAVYGTDLWSRMGWIPCRTKNMVQHQNILAKEPRGLLKF